jgi:NDP-sugar pyrophosphorylase family protein
MKAMILAAGLGTRLRPYTNRTPKPLFPIGGRPLIDILIRKLQHAGCEAIMVNTHHLAAEIDSFLKGQAYEIPVCTRYEPTLLETGGGIKNVADFWDDRPFLVVNGDIYADIDLKAAYRFHLSHAHSVTLVLHDYEEFNHVWTDGNNRVMGFGQTQPCPPRVDSDRAEKTGESPDSTALRRLAFTGIHILDRQVLDFIPEKTPFSIIAAYCAMIASGLTIKGWVVENHYWYDIGTLSGYQRAAGDALAREALRIVSPTDRDEPLIWSAIQGDGSDRTWRRVVSGSGSVVVVDHGPPPEKGLCEADAYVSIGNHLAQKGVPVPRIYGYDRPLGLVALEDLGDLHLQTLVRKSRDREEIIRYYRGVIDVLVPMAVEGAKGFDTAWTYQTSHYDRELVLEKECRYFVEAFLNGYLGLGIDSEKLKEDFELLAKNACNTKYYGFLHRDFQSRNILVQNESVHFIDFQGGRLGPFQYDLASLLIDPYVQLPSDMRDALLAYYLDRLKQRVAVDTEDFFHVFRHCVVTRNLQALGAFGFLSRIKGKRIFEAYIPPALESLKENINKTDLPSSSRLKDIIRSL